jgi:hypothetical protein
VGVQRLRQGAYHPAYRNLRRAAGLAGADERELVRGLVHLAAAGFKRSQGDQRGFERQLAHARRRLAPFLPAARGLDLEALLVRFDER